MVFDVDKLKSQFGSVNPFLICDKKDIPVEYQNITKPKGDTIYLFNNPIIILSSSIRYSPERYFVCAHELSHILLHNGLQSYYTQNHTTCAKTEHEANLMAFKICKELYKEEYGTYPECFEDLHNELGVSEDMIEFL
nr:ImmA/IrrE family metallo-endopeptidase [uncultured Ligilactobacillus sp.]